MTKGSLLLRTTFSVAVLLALGCSTTETTSEATTSSSTSAGGGSAAGGSAGTGGQGGAGCPSFPPKESCGADHAIQENCGPCGQEGLYCDFSWNCASPGSGDPYLVLTCTCTSGSWHCNSGDGAC